MTWIRTALPAPALALALVASLAACKTSPRSEGATVAPPRTASTSVPPLVPPPAWAAPPGASTSSTSSTQATTTDRGDRLERPRPVGALAPEVAPSVP